MKINPVKLLNEIEENVEVAGRARLVYALVAFFFVVFLILSLRDRIRGVMDQEQIVDKKSGGLKPRKRRR